MAGTRLTPELDLEGISPEEAFGVLGNEIRLEIIRVLWKAGALHEYDDLDTSASTISFSELRRRVDIDDNGQFNYHLSKLTPHFVRQTEHGYRLSGAGKKIARTVIAIAGERNPPVSEEVNTDCPVCGASVTVSYEDQWLRFACTECEGLFGDAAPKGTIFNAQSPPPAVSERPPDDALATQLYRCILDLAYMMHGHCRECAGRVEGTVSVCEDHDADRGATCETCGTPFAAWGELRCETCRFAKRLPVEVCILGLAPVIGFLYSQEVALFPPSLNEIVDVLRMQITTAVEENPFRVTATIEADDESLTLTMDREMSVIDISH